MGMCVMKILKTAIIGICTGFITGFFSTGGGMLLLPVLIYYFKLDEKEARATAIFSILPMVICASFFYYKGGAFDILLGIKCAIGGIAGGFLGTKIMKKIPDKILKAIFIFFLVYASYNMMK